MSRPAFNLAAVSGARQRRRSAIGLLIMVVAAVAATAIFLLDPLRRTLRDDVELIGLFESASDVTPGAAVWVAGTEVGTVETLEFLPLDNGTPRLAVTLRVPRERLRTVRADATVRIASEGLSARAAVDILPGSATAPPAQPGDTLHARRVLTAAGLRERIAVVRSAADSLRLESGPVALAARERMAALTRLQTGFSDVQAQLDELSRTFAGSPAASFAASRDLDRALGRLRDAGDAIAGADTRLRRTTDAFRPLARHAADLQARLDALTERGAPNGTLARFRNDPAIAVALERTRVQLDSLIADARANPLRYVF